MSDALLVDAILTPLPENFLRSSIVGGCDLRLCCVAVAAERLKVRRVVGSSRGQLDDVVDLEIGGWYVMGWALPAGAVRVCGDDLTSEVDGCSASGAAGAG